MSTTTNIRVGVDLLTKGVVYTTNSIMRIAFRLEHHRVPSGHFMVDHADLIEKGLKVWLREGHLLAVHMELAPPDGDEAYDRCTVDLTYHEDPKEQVAKAPMEQLEEFLGTLEKLPPDAQFRLIVGLKPGYTEVPGWGEPASLLDLKGGVKQEHEIGSGFGFGPISGQIRYYESNWNSQGQ